MTGVQVHLTTWALDDGAVDPFGVLVLIGPGNADPEWSGSRVVVRGDVVVEPCLWGEGGLFRAGVHHPFRGAVVERIRTPDRIGDPAEPVDVPRTVPHRVDGLDYLVDLRFDPP